jgi:drug/metabolite transporter (DMT)-like permease
MDSPCAVRSRQTAFDVDRHDRSYAPIGDALLVRSRMECLRPQNLGAQYSCQPSRLHYDIMNNFTVVALAAVCATLTTAGQIVLKTGVSDPGLANLLSSAGPGPFLIRALLSPLVIAGLILYVASSGLWLLILARADVSFAFPLVSMGFVLTVGYAHFVLNEQVSVTRLAGVALIMVGVALISRS